MAPRQVIHGKKGQWRPARNQGRNPNSSTSNHSQGSNINRGSQPSTPRDSQAAERGNGNQQQGPAPAAAQVPLRLRVTMPDQPPRNPGANAGSQTSQSTSGSPAQSQSSQNQSQNQGSSLGRQPPTGPTNTPQPGAPVAAAAQAPSTPVAKTPSGTLDLCDQNVGARLAAAREARVATYGPGRSATRPRRGGKVDKTATPVSNPNPQIATSAPRPAPQAPGAWADYGMAIKAHDDAIRTYVCNRNGLNLTDLDKMLGNSNLSDAHKLRNLRQLALSQDRVLKGVNQQLTRYEKWYSNLKDEHKQKIEQWQEEKESMQSEAEKQLQDYDELAWENEILALDNQRFEERVCFFHQDPFHMGMQTSAETLEGPGEIAKSQDEVEEDGLEQQTPITEQHVDNSTQTTFGDESLSQVTEAVDEIIAAGKHIENLYDDAQLSQHQCEDDDDDESSGDLDAQEAVERNPFDFLDDEDSFDWMDNCSFDIDKLVSGMQAPLRKVADASIQTEPCLTVDVGVSASVEVVDSCVQTVEVEVATGEASTQTACVDDVLSKAHVGVQVSPETKDSLVQTEPVIIHQGSWSRGLCLVFLFLLWSFVIWSWAQEEDGKEWLEVNGVYAVESRFAIPYSWVQTLRYTLSVWLQVDRVMLG